MTDDPVVTAERALGTALAARVQRLRRSQGLSLDGLAARTSLSKGTVVSIEQGKANPSIGILCRLAVAFSLSVADLLDERSQEGTDGPIERTHPATLWRTSNGSAATLEASTSGGTMFEIWSWRIAPGDTYRSDPHSRGTRELLSVREGSLVVTVGAETLILEAGEAVRLVADRPHSYAASGDRAVSFTMAVLERGEGPAQGSDLR